MTPTEFKDARISLGLSVESCASVLQVTGRSVRRWEDGTRDIPGPAKVLMRWLVTGKKPRIDNLPANR